MACLSLSLLLSSPALSFSSSSSSSSPSSSTKTPFLVALTTASISTSTSTSTRSKTSTFCRSSKSTNTLSPPIPTAASLPPKKVLVPIGYGTEEMEAVILVDVLRRAGANVVVASVEPQLEIEASSGTRLVADTSISTCSDEIFDLIALPGGMPGSARLRDCEILRKITSKHAEEKRLYGAICAAPAVTLKPWGLLKRKQMTCHPAFMDKLPSFRAVESNLQVSGELTTSRGPGTAFEFALALVDQLFGESVAREVGEMLLMRTTDGNYKGKEFNGVEWSVDNGPHSSKPQVLVPVANGSEEIEVVTIVDILRRAKADVVVASVEKSLQILASQGIKLIADKSMENAAESIYDLIILPGGMAGAERLHKSRVLKKMLKEQGSAGRMYGAICSSPTVLNRQGLLKGKRATAHPSVVSSLTNEVVEGGRVVIDGKLITSSGLATAIEFSLAVVSKLFSHARARSVAEGLVFEYPKS